jgi:hypothetical protein
LFAGPGKQSGGYDAWAAARHEAAVAWWGSTFVAAAEAYTEPEGHLRAEHRMVLALELIERGGVAFEGAIPTRWLASAVRSLLTDVATDEAAEWARRGLALLKRRSLLSRLAKEASDWGDRDKLEREVRALERAPSPTPAPAPDFNKVGGFNYDAS